MERVKYADACEIACGSEIRLRRVKERILFHIEQSRRRREIFHNFRKEFISHFAARQNISFEKLINLCYNKTKKGGVIMADSKLRDLSTDFAVKVIKMCDSIEGHYSLVNQLERSSTSIGANIHEANYAHSKADFVAKFQIALKECYETEYWLELFVKSGLIERDVARELYNQCGTIRRMLIASINTAKESAK